MVENRTIFLCLCCNLLLSAETVERVLSCKRIGCLRTLPDLQKACESNDAQPFMSSSSSLLSAKSDSTCGSTVFSPGHPRQYSLAPAMLNFADRTRRGVFIAVWPQITGKRLKLQSVPVCLLRYLLSRLDRSLKNPELLVVRPVSSWRTRAMTANSGRGCCVHDRDRCEPVHCILLLRGPLHMFVFLHSPVATSCRTGTVHCAKPSKLHCLSVWVRLPLPQTQS